MQKFKYSIIIPTRNRPTLLKKLISKIEVNQNNLLEIIIVDSSDQYNKSKILKNPKIKYVHTDQKSAAVQRNIGIKSASKKSKYVFFLDDDVSFNKNYFNSLIDTLNINNAVGASGLAINPKNNKVRTAPNGIFGTAKRIFLLDSKIEGKLLRSAVNIPCRKNQKSLSNILEVDWLIGCAAWRSDVLKKAKFEESFKGQSLGEDVLFSNQLKKYGKIVVNKSVILDHEESDLERPNELEFNRMWIKNRYLISKKLKLSPLNLAFHWSNLGKILTTIFTSKQNRSSALNGIFCGYMEIIKKS